MIQKLVVNSYKVKKKTSRAGYDIKCKAVNPEPEKKVEANLSEKKL